MRAGVPEHLPPCLHSSPTNKQMRWYVDDRQFASARSSGGQLSNDSWFSLGAGGQPVAGDAPFGDQEFYLLLNLALGSEATPFTTNLNGGVPIAEERLIGTFQQAAAAGQDVRMEVDSVRVYGRPAAGIGSPVRVDPAAVASGDSVTTFALNP